MPGIVWLLGRFAMASTMFVTVRSIGEYRSSLERDSAFEQNHCTPVLCSSETGLPLQAPRSHNADETRILSNMVRATVAVRKFSQRSLVREDFACLIPF